MKKKAGTIALIVAVTLAGIVFATWFLAGRYLKGKGIPDYSRPVSIRGLSGPVTVYRDVYGVPHVYANNERDLYMATGWCMAQDRLWQMDLLRRVTTGRLSEIFGADLVEADTLFRSLRIQEKSEEILRKSDPSVTAALEAFATGVNRFIDTHSGDLPPEFFVLGYSPEHWQPVHSVNLVGYMGWDLTMPWEIEPVMNDIRQRVGEDLYRELLPDISLTTSRIYASADVRRAVDGVRIAFSNVADRVGRLGAGVFNASNNWAVSGSRSASGKPLLANDMHLGLRVPGIWYQIHQNVEGGLNVTGVAVPGEPFVVSGHNGDIAWGMTNVMIDDMDFFLERTDPDNPRRYEYRGQWRDMDVRREKIGIKGGKSVTREIAYTVHGPVVSGFKKIGDRTITMHWIGNYFSNEVQSVCRLNHAKNFNDFKEALRTFRALSQNVAYADREGNVGMLCAAGIPIRKKGNGVEIAPGWTDEYEWSGFVPFEQQPFMYNPSSGIVLSANNKTVSDAYPHYISLWYYPPYRYDRIKDFLESGSAHGPESFMKLQTDQLSPLAVRMKDRIVRVMSDRKDLDGTCGEALQMLAAWDCVMGPANPEAALFDAWYVAFMKNTFGDEMGDKLYGQFLSQPEVPAYAVDQLFRKGESKWFDDVTTPDRRESMEDIIDRSFRVAVEWLDEKQGSKPRKWCWGEAHRLTLEHPLGGVAVLGRLLNLNLGPYQVGGSYHTVCPYSYPFNKPFDANDGASQRHVYDLSDWDNSWSLIPAGNSGVPGSPHYADQAELYVKGRYHRDYFSDHAVKKHAAYITRMSPQ